ncbi:MAG: ABC transporter permease [Clostridia bacterium]|nr:ABC transporter permease [Clostridia bacterium]
MKSIRQVWRQPTRWILGILLIALSVAVLCVCLGQSFSAGVAQEGLDDKFITLAFPSDVYGAAADRWIVEYAKENPDVITSISSPGFASAYIGGLTADNFTDYIHYDSYKGFSYKPYDRVVFEITLESIVPVQEDSFIVPDEAPAWNGESVFEGIRVALTGRVDSVIALQENYSDPTGFTVKMTLEVADEAALEALDLQIGQRYLVYGTDYVDNDYLLRNMLAQSKNTELYEAFDHSKYETYRNGRNQYVAKIRFGHLITGITASQHDMYRTVSFKLTNLAEALTVEYRVDENGVKRPVSGTSFVDLKGNPKEYTAEEYAAKYGNPFIARLDGTAEQFLASEAGAEWKKIVDTLKLSYGTFPVISVNTMNELTHFARGNAKIVEGADFSDEDIASGARVCIISETVARLNGISVGDKISLSYYEKNVELPMESILSDGEGVTNPSAAFYDPETTPLSDSEEYTVVGLYRKSEEWSSSEEDFYGFTPNTVFVPQGVIDVTEEHSHGGLFRSFVIKNGCLEEFALAVSDAGFDEQLLFDDNGYADMENSLADYENTADRIIPLGFVVWSVVTALFVLLFPLRQGRELDTMDSLGCNRLQRIWHVIVSSAGILIPGSLLGLGVGMLLWESVVELMSYSATGSLKIEMDIGYFVLIALIQLFISLLAVVAVSVPMTRTRGLDKRR